MLTAQNSRTAIFLAYEKKRIAQLAHLTASTLAIFSLMLCSPAMSAPQNQVNTFPETRVKTGADALVASNFSLLDGKRIGLITNQTGLVNGRHLADLISEAPNVKLQAILAPEHGFRGSVEAGAKVSDDIDPQTGVRVFSLYGKTRKPTPSMLKNLDVLVFDIQDIGVRFYTYISTMGLAMQAAAEANIPFVVLDRPNPLGGDYVSGFVLEPSLESFVGQYPIPIVHGMTVGELAIMIKNEKFLEGIQNLKLTVIETHGWTRNMRWPQTHCEWIWTSPNIPTFESALLYPGIGVVGETFVNEGRGTNAPFTRFGAPWYDSVRATSRLNAQNLPGVEFKSVTYTPRTIKNVAQNPRFKNKAFTGIAINVTDVAAVEPLELGIYILADLASQAQLTGTRRLFPNLKMFHLISGTKRLHQALKSKASGDKIIQSWQHEVEEFKIMRKPYLLY